MIPYSRPKLSDFFTLSQTKLLKNHTFTALHTHVAYIREYPFQASYKTAIVLLPFSLPHIPREGRGQGNFHTHPAGATVKDSF